MKQISIIIPCFNEAKRLPKSVQKIEQYMNYKKYDYEIIIVDDGSTDNTKKLYKNKKYITIISYKPNKGKGFAIKTGILHATYEIILCTDADLSTPIDNFEKLHKYSKEYDIIIGSRNLKESNIIRRQPQHRRILGKIFRKVSSRILNNEIKDSQCGFKLFKKSTMKNILPLTSINRFSFDVELLLIAQTNKIPIKEVPVEWKNDPLTTVRIFKDGPQMIQSILKIILRSKQHKYSIKDQTIKINRNIRSKR